MSADPKMFIRAAAIAAVGAAALAASFQLRGVDQGGDIGILRLHPRWDDPLSFELARCRQIGREAAEDQACLRAWVENRKRFFEPGRPAITERPAEMVPTTQPAPRTKDPSRLCNGASDCSPLVSSQSSKDE